MTRDERLRTLFHANAADLLNYFARRVVPVDDAADLLSETLMTACRRIRTLPADDERARMWLFVTAKNTLRNHRRGSHRRAALVERLADAIITTPPAFDGNEHDDLRDAIASLDPRAREVIRLVYWDGFTIAEAAQMLGVPASTARGRLHTARQRLQSQLSSTHAREPQSTRIDNPITLTKETAI